MDRKYNVFVLYYEYLNTFLVAKRDNFSFFLKPFFIFIVLCFIISCGGGSSSGDGDNVEEGQYFLVTFDTRGGSAMPTLKLTTSKKIGEFSRPTKDGASFIGWVAQKDSTTYINPDFIIRSDTTLYALWGYNVYFDTKGGSSIDDQVVFEGSSMSLLPSPTKVGGVFLGWTEDPLSIIPNTTLIIDRDITLYAIWSDLYFTVAFDSQGGSLVESISVKYGGGISPLPTPIYMGKIFSGWSTIKEGSTPDFSSSSEVYHDTKLFAVWKDPIIITVTVTFDTNGGDVLPPITVEEKNTLGAMLPTPINSADTDALFIGWTAHANSTVADFFQNTVVTNDLILYAIWQVKVEFKNTSNTSILPIYILKGSSLSSRLATPQNGQLKFYGWSTVADSTSVNFTKDTVINSSVVVYAIWQAKISFDSNGGTLFNDRYVITGQHLGSLPTPTNDAFIFCGWSSDSSGTISNVHSLTIVRDDMVLYALWEVRYKVSFETRDALLIVEPRYYNEDAILRELPVFISDNKIFLGWSTSDSLPEFEPDIDEYHRVVSSFTLYALWADTRAVVTFDSDGGSLIKPAIVYNGKIGWSLPTAFKKGFVFLGWSTQLNPTIPNIDMSSVMVEDETLYAVWQIESYTIEFNLNSGTLGVGSTQLIFDNISGGSTVGDIAYGLVVEPPVGMLGKMHRWWSDTPDGTGEIYHNRSIVGKSMVLYAIFAEEIKDTTDFNNISCDDDAFYYLASNLIFMSESNVCPNAGFSGVLDGASKNIFSFVTLAGNTIDNITTQNIGIFAQLDGANIFDLVLYSELNLTILQGGNYDNIGLLAGSVINSTLENINISGTLKVSNANSQSDVAKQNIGLFAGMISMSNLDNISVAGELEVDSLPNYPHNIGGIAGNIWHSELSNSYSNTKLNIIANESQLSVGGAVGLLDNMSLMATVEVINNGANIVGNYIHYGGIVGFINRQSSLYNAKIIYSDRVLIDSYGASVDLSFDIGGAVGRALDRSYIQYTSSKDVHIDTTASATYQIQNVNIGGLVGRAEGVSISQSSSHVKYINNDWFSTASIGDISVGGLVGKLVVASDDSIGNFFVSDSYAFIGTIKQDRTVPATMEEHSYIGGLIGYIEGRVNDRLIYSIMRVHTYIENLNINDTNAYVGGMFGHIDPNAKLSNFISIVSGSTALNYSKAKRAIGNDDAPNILNAEIFSNMDMLINGDTVEDSYTNGIGVVIPQDELFYTSKGWDFDNIWNMSSDVGIKLPILR